jgi:hypothetical protein
VHADFPGRLRIQPPRLPAPAAAARSTTATGTTREAAAGKPTAKVRLVPAPALGAERVGDGIAEQILQDLFRITRFDELARVRPRLEFTLVLFRIINDFHDPLQVANRVLQDEFVGEGYGVGFAERPHDRIQLFGQILGHERLQLNLHVGDFGESVALQVFLFL